MPTIVIQPNETVSKDASFIINGTTNYNSGSLRIGAQPGELSNRTAIQFDLSTLPIGSVIKSARVVLTMSGQHSLNSLPIGVHEIQSEWDEDTITGFNHPIFNPVTEVIFNSSVGTNTFTITSLAQSWASGTKANNGVLLKIATSGGVSEDSQETAKFFHSADATTADSRPKLIIDYNVPPTAPNLIKPNGGELFNAVETVSWTASTDFEGMPVTYEIQLSTDNGLKWRTLDTNLTSLTTNYNFINVAETSRAKIRVRAYDGETYSQWDESNGVFTIQHNIAPTIPTNLSPSGIPVDRLKTSRLTWRHNDSPNDIQSKAEIQWRKQGNLLWYFLASDGPEQEYFIPPNTFPNGQTEWRVRTYDAAGLESPWSNISVFTVAESANVPIIIQPSGESVNVSRPVIEWSSASQSSYQIIIEDALSNVVWDSGEVASTVKARTLGVDLINGGSYKLKVRVKDGSGLFSSFTDKTIIVSYTTPSKPIVESFLVQAGIGFSITNPTPIGSEPNLVENEVYKQIGDEWIRIAKGIISIFTDYGVASEENSKYLVRAIGDNGTFIESDVIDKTAPKLRGVWLSDVYDPESTIYQFLYVDKDSRSDNLQRDHAFQKFQGRSRPTLEVGPYSVYSISMTIHLVRDKTGRERLIEFIKNSSTLLYRDNRGRKFYTALPQLGIADVFYGDTIELNFTEIDYQEGV